MENDVLKTELRYLIDQADGEELKEIYLLVINYFSGQNGIGDWESLPQWEKERIELGLQQANEGLGRPASEVLQEIREKYGL